MKKHDSENHGDRAALENLVMGEITRAFRETDERKALRQATKQTDDVLEDIMASASVQRRFANALSAYLIEQTPRVLEEVRTKAFSKDGNTPAKIFLDLGGTGQRVQGAASSAEETPDNTVEYLEKEMARNLRELMLSDAKEPDED